MKKILVACTVAALAISTAAHARNDSLMLSVEQALSTADAKAKLGDNILFYFGEAKPSKIKQPFGTDTTTRKTNAFNKSDEEACQWAFLSAMIALKEKAQRLGANAVINIRSYSDRVEKRSNTEFECRVGALIASVTLRAEYAQVQE